MKPILIPYRNGGVFIGSKAFTIEDVKCGIILRKKLIDDDNWFGGNVYAFGKTVDGFLLCIGADLDADTGEVFSTNAVIGVYIPTLEGLTDNAVDMLTEAGYLKPIPLPAAIPEPLPFEPELEIDDTPEPPMSENAVEITKKITEIVNKKVAARPKRITKAGKGRKR